jgi:hypothetical protein
MDNRSPVRDSLVSRRGRAMDTGVSVAFDHRDPTLVTRIGGIRVD